MAGELVDQFGFPATYAAGNPYAGDENRDWRMSRPRLDSDMARMFSRQRHRNAMADSRYIYCAFPLVSGGVAQKADYVSASGWRPQYVGEDKEWGRKAEEVLNAALEFIDIRGPFFSWGDNWRIGSQLMDIDGDYFILLAEDPATGYPRLQWLEGHRVGCRNGESEVKAGPFKGRKILNGIIYNRHGREIGYRILGATEPEDRDVSADNVIHVGEASWFSEGRPMPSLAYAILDWYDIKETRGFEKLAAKMNSAIALIEENQSGTRPVNPLPGMTPATSAGGVQVQTFEGGLIRYIKSGNALKAHLASRPADQWQRFDKTLIAGAFFGMRWRIEMMDLSSLTGAGVRGFADNINKAIRHRHSVQVRFAKRAMLWTVAKLIKMGELPESSTWDKWTFPVPKEFTVDEKHSITSAIERIRSGLSSTPAEIRRLGYGKPEQIVREQAEHEALKRQIAEEFGVDETNLGRVDKPGDLPQSNTPGNDNQTENEDEEDDEA